MTISFLNLHIWKFKRSNISGTKCKRTKNPIWKIEVLGLAFGILHYVALCIWYWRKFICIVDTGRKLNVHKTFWTSSESLIYVQFTSCVYWVRNFNMTHQIRRKINTLKKRRITFWNQHEIVQYEIRED